MLGKQNDSDADDKTSLWKKLPTTVKLYLLGGVGVLVLLFLIVGVLMGITPSNFLSYSDSAQESEDIQRKYEEYWNELCSEESDACSAEEVERANKLKDSQTKFYKKLDSLVKKYNLSNEKKYIVLATIFYDVDIEEFVEGSEGAYEFDEDDEINYENSENVYDREKDSLKNLIKRFKKTSNEEESIESYYKYLKESTYFDEKPHLQSYFKEYKRKHNLSDNISEWAEEERQEVRQEIIDNIKDIVSSFEDKKEDKTYDVVNTSQYLWPIGSADITTDNGIDFAKGDDPVPSTITSYYGPRDGVFTSGTENHGALDIGPNGNPSGTVPVIAAKSGTVIKISKRINFPDDEDYLSGEATYGNFIKIQHDDGLATLYAHLYKNTIKVKEGDHVEQGQVIGYVGSSGASTGPHLHFEVRDNETRVDPLEYVDPNNPRPKALGTTELTGDFATLVRWIDEFEGGTQSANGEYYTVSNKLDGVYTTGHGITLIYNRAQFAKYGINVDDYMSNSALIPASIVDQVRIDVVTNMLSHVQKTTSDAGLALNDYQLYALTSFSFNLGPAYIPNFIKAYQQYGDTDALYNNFFGRYVNSGGKVLSGLVTRRKKEFELFHNHVWSFGYS